MRSACDGLLHPAAEVGIACRAVALWAKADGDRMRLCCVVLGRPGGDLLSRVLGRSTIGAEGFHGRVRDGIGCIAPRNDHQVVQGSDE